MLEIYHRSRELNRSTNINFDAGYMIVTGYWWGWAGFDLDILEFRKGYPINPPLQSPISLIFLECQGLDRLTNTNFKGL